MFITDPTNRSSLKGILYSKETDMNFNYDALQGPTVWQLFTPQDIAMLHEVSSSLKYSGKMKLKLDTIREIMRPRGFVQLACGTNRVVYRHTEYTSFVVKVALSLQGLQDNPAEYYNQFKIKPFCTKVFDVTPCGTLSIVEKVNPITSINEFIQCKEDIYDVIVLHFLGKYVMEDIGAKYFLNYGIRQDFGPVILDFSFVYELDGAKLNCCNINPNTGQICGGEIDYDDGFNYLRCDKCGCEFLAKNLAKKIENKELKLIKYKGEDLEMEARIFRGKKLVGVINTNNESNCIDKEKYNKVFSKKEETNSAEGFITIRRGNQVEAVLSDDGRVVDRAIKVQDTINKNEKIDRKEKINNKNREERKEKVSVKLDDICSSVSEPEKEVVVDDTYTTNIDDDKNMDMYTALGINPHDVDPDLQIKEETEDVSDKNEDSVIDKYEEEYGDIEYDNFSKIRKGKRNYDNY